MLWLLNQYLIFTMVIKSHWQNPNATHILTLTLTTQNPYLNLNISNTTILFRNVQYT